jgi:hypothetical protein
VTVWRWNCFDGMEARTVRHCRTFPQPSLPVASVPTARILYPPPAPPAHAGHSRAHLPTHPPAVLLCTAVRPPHSVPTPVCGAFLVKGLLDGKCTRAAAAASTPLGPRARLHWAERPTPSRPRPWSASKSLSAHALAWAALWNDRPQTMPCRALLRNRESRVRAETKPGHSRVPGEISNPLWVWSSGLSSLRRLLDRNINYAAPQRPKRRCAESNCDSTAIGSPLGSEALLTRRAPWTSRSGLATRY